MWELFFMKVLISGFNLFKGGSKTIYDGIVYQLAPILNVMFIGFGDYFVFERSKIIIRYPIPVLNWLYRLFIENIFIAVVAYIYRADKIIMMGNFPCIFWFKDQTVFFHNTIYLDKTQNGITIKEKLEKRYFKYCIKKKRPKILVQTEYIKSLIIDSFNFSIKVEVIGSPINYNYNELIESKKSKSLISFIYPAYYYPHKNHRLIFNNSTFFKDINSSVYLTIESEYLILNNIENGPFKLIGSVTQEEIFDLYKSANALLYVSLQESLGIPLLEACYFKIPIIAPDLPYVNAVVDNFYSFNPEINDTFIYAVKSCIDDIRNKCQKIPDSKVDTNPLHFINSLLKS